MRVMKAIRGFIARLSGEGGEEPTKAPAGADEAFRRTMKAFTEATGQPTVRVYNRWSGDGLDVTSRFPPANGVGSLRSYSRW